MTGVSIDIDGPGPLAPVSVLCGVDSAGVAITAVQHDTEEKTKVDGFQAPGSFSQTIFYTVFYFQHNESQSHFMSINRHSL